MWICVGKDCYDYFAICKIKYILIDESYTNIYCLGTTTTIIYNPDFGVYEQCKIKGLNYNVKKIFVFPYTCLLALHPILETNLHSSTCTLPVYVFKYTPLDL